MRESISSYAIIKASFKKTEKYLMQFNNYWNSYNFISGHYEPDKDHENYEYTIIREIEEELVGLIHKIDFSVKPLSATPLKTIHYSERFQKMTSYEFHLFQLFFLKPFNTYDHFWKGSMLNQWFTIDEIMNGISKRGMLITKFPLVEIDRFLPGGLTGLPSGTIHIDTKVSS